MQPISKFMAASRLALLAHLLCTSTSIAATAGKPSGDDLTIAANGNTSAVIVVSPGADPQEKLAASDLAQYIGLMSGAKPRIANTRQAIADALSSMKPVLIVGEQALKMQPELRAALGAVLKKKPHLRSDGIALKRVANRVYLAANNPLSHYFAVVELLRRWGCRWYMPTEFGECIPQ